MRRWPLFAFLLLPLGGARADRADDYLRGEMRRRHIPGMAVAVLRDGRVVKAQGYGLASVELGAPVTENTVFEIGSITKQFTAAAILLLAQDGKVRLDAPVSRYLPGTPPSWKGVTVQRLLAHTSGIKNRHGVGGLDEDYAATMRDVGKPPLDFAPGAKWSYDNTGYQLLGYVIERASGQSYWDFLRGRIFRPLGMAATGGSDPAWVTPHRARGAQWNGRRWENRDPISSTGASSSGAVTSTVGDMMKWDKALLDGRILTRAGLTAMWTPARLNDGRIAGTSEEGFETSYGFGWVLNTWKGHRVIMHTGGTGAFSACNALFPDDHLAVIVLTNLGGYNARPFIGQAIAGFYVPALIPPYAMGTRPDPDPRRTAMLVNVMRDYAKGVKNPAHMAAGLQATVPQGGMPDVLPGLKDAASFHFLYDESVAGRGVRVKDTPVTRIIHLRQTTLGQTYYWKFYIAPDGRVADTARF